MLEVRLAELPQGLAIETDDGVVLVNGGQSQAEATRAAQSLRPRAERHAVARAVAIAYGSPITTPIPTPAGRLARPVAGRHRRPAGTPPPRAPSRGLAEPAGFAVPGQSLANARSRPRRGAAEGAVLGRAGLDPAWWRRTRLAAATAAVLAVAPPLHALRPPATAGAATPPTAITTPGATTQPVPAGTPVTFPVTVRPARPRPVAATPPPAASSAIPPLAAPAPAQAPAGGPPAQTSTAPSQPAPAPSRAAAPQPTRTSPPPPVPDPVPTVVGTLCTLLPPQICPTG